MNDDIIFPILYGLLFLILWVLPLLLVWKKKKEKSIVIRHFLLCIIGLTLLYFLITVGAGLRGFDRIFVLMPCVVIFYMWGLIILIYCILSRGKQRN